MSPANTTALLGALDGPELAEPGTMTSERVLAVIAAAWAGLR